MNEGDAQGSNSKETPGIGLTYGKHLQLNKLLSCTALQSEEHGDRVDDEHLFITVHQSYELWFKQIIVDIDKSCVLLIESNTDETKTLQVVLLLDRVIRILKLLVDQLAILETITPMDFFEFRKYLSNASGLQSWQFRVLENKIGLRPDRRIKCNAQHYKKSFLDKAEMKIVEDSEIGLSLFTSAQKWLEETPGLRAETVNGKVKEGFWPLYERAVKQYLSDIHEKECPTQSTYDQTISEYNKTRDAFSTILDPELYAHQLSNGTRLLSHEAIKGALMICFYRNIPRYSQPYQILVRLMDIDSLFMKFRHSHMLLVQRMLGNKQGTGSTSGYMYLRSTVSDQYRVFVDLFNLPSWFIPREYIPPLSQELSTSPTRSTERLLP